MTPHVNGNSALFLDIDGTLLDLARTPDAVVVPGDLQRALVRLAEDLKGGLAFVSGRSLIAIDRLFAPLRTAAIGCHGAEVLAERKSRHVALYKSLLENDIALWGDRFLSSLMGTKSFDLKAARTPPRHASAALPH